MNFHYVPENFDHVLTKHLRVTRFAELRRAFRVLDEDASGQLDRDEFKGLLNMFNMGVPDKVRIRPLSDTSP